MKHWQKFTLPINGLKLTCYRSGADKPPVVLVHGFTDNALYWTQAALALAEHFEVIAYDARGHGTSDRIGGRFADEDRVSDLLGVLNTLGLEAPGLIGHSMGGATVALFAAQHPARARFLVLEDPAWYEPEATHTPEEIAAFEAQRRSDFQTWRERIRAQQTGTAEEALKYVQAEHPTWSLANQQLSRDAKQQVDITVFDYYPKLWSPWRALAPQLPCPTLLVIGERSLGGIITPEQAAEAASLNPRLRWAQIAGAGHSIRYEQFEAYMDTVLTFALKAQAVHPL